MWFTFTSNTGYPELRNRYTLLWPKQDPRWWAGTLAKPRPKVAVYSFLDCNWLWPALFISWFWRKCGVENTRLLFPVIWPCRRRPPRSPLIRGIGTEGMGAGTDRLMGMLMGSGNAWNNNSGNRGASINIITKMQSSQNWLLKGRARASGKKVPVREVDLNVFVPATLAFARSLVAANLIQALFPSKWDNLENDEIR